MTTTFGQKNKLNVSSPSFQDNGWIPKKHTDFGEDASPAFHLEGLSKDAVSIAIVMDDLDIPFLDAYNHWIIWNIPSMTQIPENISYGAIVEKLGNAKQGIGYGKNRYRGPKQPIFIRKMHRYQFDFYVLDCFLALKSTAKKRELLLAVDGHIVQTGRITGQYKR
ncbi:MAG: hypothetical protein PWP24_1528 [Clostridiales bacterium]|nr:hypothetical protein [Clostridiales bacterium]